MAIESPKISEQNMKSLERSSIKNNKLLIFFYLSSLYIFISVLNTTDLMLLLPTDTFKMPLIGFDLNLVYFYVLAPLLLVLLHFNILFNYHEHLQKLHAYKGEFSLETIDSSMYNYVYISIKHGLFKGLALRVLLLLLIYIFPLLVFIAIYHRFAAYHHTWITEWHLFFLGLDIILIFWSIYENKNYSSQSRDNIMRFFSSIMVYILAGVILIVLFLEVSYYYFYFKPLTSTYNSKLIQNYDQQKQDFLRNSVCKIHHFFLEPDRNKPIDCFPRIIVTETDIAKISKASVYIPSLFKSNPEKTLILDYGARINLSNRNLRYSDLHSCILTRADMHNTQLQNANLSKAHLQAVKFDNAQLQDADMREAELQKAEFINTKLQGASFVRANMTESYFEHSNLSTARMSFTRLDKTSFNESDLKSVDFRNAKLNETYFERVDLVGTSFQNAKVSDVTFDEVNLTASDFSKVQFFSKKDNIPLFNETNICCLNIFQSILDNPAFKDSRKEILFDINISDNHLSQKYNTFDERRIFYLARMKNSLKSRFPKEEENQLDSLLKASCTRLKLKKEVYEIKKRGKIYDSLKNICDKSGFWSFTS